MRDIKKIRTITLEQIKKAPRLYFMSNYLPYYVKVERQPQAVIVSKEEYDQLRNLARYKKVLENICFLAHNKSLDFLKEEPDLYEQYS